MLNLVPFRGSRWKVGYFNLKARFIGKQLKLVLPDPSAAAVTATTVTVDVQSFGFRKCVLSNSFPPPINAFSCKLCCIMTGSKINESGVVIQYIYPIWIHFPEFGDRKIMIQYFPR